MSPTSLRVRFLTAIAPILAIFVCAPRVSAQTSPNNGNMHVLAIKEVK